MWLIPAALLTAEQESVLVVHNDVTLANSYVDGVFAVFVTQAIAVTTADHFFFAVALGNADLNVHLFLLAAFAAGGTGITALLAGITAFALAFAGARIVNFDDFRHCTGCHFVKVHVLDVFKQVNRCTFSNRLRSSFLSVQLADQQSQTHQGRNSKRFHVYLSLSEHKRRLNHSGANTPQPSAASLLNQPCGENQPVSDYLSSQAAFQCREPYRFTAVLISNAGEE
ncbi:MAG: hypothetical protein ACK6EB_40825 [Planctomyces sp.]